MSSDPRTPLNLRSPLIDISPLVSHLIELASRQGLQATQEGYGMVVQEIRDNQELWGIKAGVSAQDLATLQSCDNLIADIDVVLPTVDHLRERLLDTRHGADDQRHRTILTIAQSVDRRSRHAPELQVKYEKTRTYRSATAKKALRTRRRNEAEAETGGKTEGAVKKPSKTKKRTARAVTSPVPAIKPRTRENEKSPTLSSSDENAR
jgi:hypothetical protein